MSIQEWLLVNKEDAVSMGLKEENYYEYKAFTQFCYEVNRRKK